MEKDEKLALFLGMLSGDGCLSIQHSGGGYRDYAVRFSNTNKILVDYFDELFYNLYKLHGTIRFDDRENRKRLWSFCKYSKEIVNQLIGAGFPEGVKRDVLRVLRIINEGNKEEKLAFIKRVLITDGCVRKNKTIIFHSGSELFLEDLSKLIGEFIGEEKQIKEYIQRENIIHTS